MLLLLSIYLHICVNYFMSFCSDLKILTTNINYKIHVVCDFLNNILTQILSLHYSMEIDAIHASGHTFYQTQKPSPRCVL